MDKYRGNAIKAVDGLYVYTDTNKPVSQGERGCGKCGSFRTKDGHDNCLGGLPFVMNACCGHGNVSDAYVQFLDKSVVSGEDAVLVIKKFKGLAVDEGTRDLIKKALEADAPGTEGLTPENFMEGSPFTIEDGPDGEPVLMTTFTEDDLVLWKTERGRRRVNTIIVFGATLLIAGCLGAMIAIARWVAK
jgi:hypothetical protein